MESRCKWDFVRIAENKVLEDWLVMKFRIWSTPSTYFPRLFQVFCTANE